MRNGRVVQVIGLVYALAGLVQGQGEWPGVQATFVPKALARAKGQATKTSSAEMMPMPSVAPLFVEDDRRTSVVSIVSNGATPLDLDITLSGPAGEELARQTVTIDPHGQQTVALASLLPGGATVPFGSVMLMPHRPSTFGAQLSIVGRNGAPVNDIEEEFVMMMDSQPARYRAVTTASFPPLIAIRSLSSTKQTVSIDCLTKGGPNRNGGVTIESNQTLLVQGCLDGGPAPLKALGDAALSVPMVKKGIGVTVSSSAPSSELAVFGVGLGTQGLSWALPFANVNKLNSAMAVYPGVPLGQSAAFGPQAFTLQAAIANFGDRPTTATFLASGASGGQSTLATVTVAPRQVVSADLNVPPDGTASAGSIVIRSDAQTGDVLTDIQAVSPSAGPAASLPLPWKDLSQKPNGGQHPWRTDASFTSTVVLFNPDSSRSNGVAFTVTADGKTWSKQVTVPPLTTVPVNINDIVVKQQPDDKGATLSPTSSHGLVTWVTLANPKIFGMLAQADGTSGTLRPFACAACSAVCGANLTSLTELLGDTGETSATSLACGTNCDCTCVEQCGGSSASISTWDWSSQNPSIASLTSGGIGVGDYLGNAGGSTFSNLTLTDNNFCSSSGGGPINVQIPTSVSVVNTIQQGAAVCSSGQAGWSRKVTLQLLDQSGAAIQKSAITMADSITMGSPNDLGASNTRTGSVSTDSSGQWADSYFVCSTACPGSGESDGTQAWTANGTSLSHSNAIVYKCTSITVDGK